jgi:hypothetical protein
MIRWTLSSLGIALTLGALAFWLWKPAKTPARPEDQRAEEVEDLRASLRALQKQVDTMDGRGPARPVLAAPAQGVPVEDAGTSRSGEADPVQPRQAPTEVEIVAGLDDKFAEEEVDATWSNAAASQLTRVLSTHLPRGSTLARVECRKDMCRIESRHADTETYQEFAKSSFMDRNSGVWNGGFSSWIVDKTAAGVVAVSHLAKEGQDLPSTGDGG